jgi:hypothetical protein
LAYTRSDLEERAFNYARYSGPPPGLYHCGTGAHLGGGVTGAPVHNAAREIIRNLRACDDRHGMRDGPAPDPSGGLSAPRGGSGTA